MRARRRRTNRCGARCSTELKIKQLSKREAEMAGKRQSNENVRKARRSQAVLGQKKAGLEKASKEELRHMEGSTSAQRRKAKEADLGQKAAALERTSDQELEQMGSGGKAALARPQGRST